MVAPWPPSKLGFASIDRLPRGTAPMPGRSASRSAGRTEWPWVQAWLARPGCRIKLHFIPAYCPHLDPIERLWGLMNKHVTHNRCHATFADFSGAILTFLREEVPRKWHLYCDAVSDNFRVISPKDFRILT